MSIISFNEVKRSFLSKMDWMDGVGGLLFAIGGILVVFASGVPGGMMLTYGILPVLAVVLLLVALGGIVMMVSGILLAVRNF